MDGRSWVIPLKMPDSQPNGNRPNAVLRIISPSALSIVSNGAKPVHIGVKERDGVSDAVAYLFEAPSSRLASRTKIFVLCALFAAPTTRSMGNRSHPT